MRALATRWRLSLRRTRADWPIVAAAFLITLLATTVFAAGPIYSSAAALAGLRRTLADAPATDSSVQVSLYGTPTYVAGVDGEIHSDLNAALAPLAVSIVRDGQAAATLALPPAADGATTDRAVLGFLDDLPNHATLVQGDWPQTGGPSDPLQVVILSSVADARQLKVGDTVDLIAPNVSGQATVPVRVVGIFSVNDASDAYWYGDPQLTTGVELSGKDRTLGPFLTTPEGVLRNPALNSVHMQWRAFPDFTGLTIDNVAAIHGRLNALPNRVKATVTGSVAVATSLPDILGNAEKSLLVSRTEVLLLMAQLAIMAAYAIVLTASLLVDHRRMETALLRSRGASAGHIAWLAFVEGLLLVIPAVLVAPWLAAGLASVLDVAGPLADIGLKIAPQVTSDAYLLAGAAGLVCLVLLVVPAFLAARSLASADRELSRQETRTFGHRMGLDIALLAVSIVALWQLRLYGAPLTRTVQGNLGFDPLLVAAPALGLLAGGILALRVLPYLASLMEAWVSRGRELVASLGSRQLARRPLRYTRTALLLMLALSLGVFALSYAETWSTSQKDQAAYQVGADVRTTTTSGATGTILAPAAYEGIPGVQAVMPVERIERGVSLAKGDVDVLALNSDAAGSIVHFRTDEATQPLDQLMQALHDGRPNPEFLTLAGDAAYLRVNGLLDLHSIVKFSDNIDDQPIPLDPATLTDLKIAATAIVRDAHGLIFRLSSAPATVTDTQATIILPLALPTKQGSVANLTASGKLDGPLQLLGLDLVVSLPANSLTTDARIGATSVASGATADGPWTDLPTTDWSGRFAPSRSAIEDVAPSSVDGMVMQVGGENGESFLNGGAAAGRVIFISSALKTLDAPLPVVVNPAFLKAVGTQVGETIDVTIDQPTLDLLRLQATTTVRDVDEWWMQVAVGTSADVAAALSVEPFNSSDVVSTDAKARGLSTDPVALGIIGALLIGFVATGLFALVALIVSAAVSARQRRTEFALLRALGLSGSQLSRWLWLENASVVVVSLIAGTALGIVISLIALPFITVTQQATSPVPGVLVQMPWDRILILDLVVLVCLGVAVAILAVALRRIGVGSILRLGED